MYFSQLISENRNKHNSSLHKNNLTENLKDNYRPSNLKNLKKEQKSFNHKKDLTSPIRISNHSFNRHQGFRLGPYYWVREEERLEVWHYPGHHWLVQATQQQPPNQKNHQWRLHEKTLKYHLSKQSLSKTKSKSTRKRKTL